MELSRKWLAGSGCLAVIALASLIGGCEVRPAGHVDVVDVHGWHHTGYYDDHHDWHGGYYDDRHGYHDDPHDWHQ
jgi:hypothetical protein